MIEFDIPALDGQGSTENFGPILSHLNTSEAKVPLSTWQWGCFQEHHQEGQILPASTMIFNHCAVIHTGVSRMACRFINRAVGGSELPTAAWCSMSIIKQF